MYVHNDTSFGGTALWEGPIAYMFIQFMKSDVCICPSLTCFQSLEFLELLLSWQRRSWLPAPKDVLHQRSDSTSSTSSTSNEPRATLNETPKRDTSWVYQLYQYDLWSGNQRSLLRVHRAPRFCDYDLSIFFTADLHGTLWKACGKCPSLLITFVSPVMSHGFKREH